MTASPIRLEAFIAVVLELRRVIARAAASDGTL
jgi:hypothetical protein